MIYKEIHMFKGFQISKKKKIQTVAPHHIADFVCLFCILLYFRKQFGNAFVFLKMLNFFKSVNYFPERATVIFSYNKQTTMLIAFDKIHLYIVDYNRHVVFRIARKKELFIWSAGLNMRDM